MLRIQAVWTASPAEMEALTYFLPLTFQREKNHIIEWDGGKQAPTSFLTARREATKLSTRAPLCVSRWGGAPRGSLSPGTLPFCHIVSGSRPRFWGLYMQAVTASPSFPGSSPGHVQKHLLNE